MFIEKLKVTNFKSFDEIDISLGKFNVFIGANASGKSNFASIFKFLGDIARFGLDNAISMHGGVDFIKNVNIGVSKDLSVELRINFERNVDLPIGKKRQKRGFYVDSLLYRFTIKFYTRGKMYAVKEEILEVDIYPKTLKTNNGGSKKKKELRAGTLLMRRDEKNKVTAVLEAENLPIKLGDILPGVDLFTKEGVLEMQTPKALILVNTVFGIPINLVLFAFFRDLEVYDIDPKLPKRSSLITGKTVLESDASNLAIVLGNIVKKKKDREKLCNLVKDLLPFIQGITVQKMVDRSLIACLRETYSGKRFLPASLMSDGTINLTAMIIALYFEVRPLIVIEEPDRNIHPHLVSKLVDMMKEVSEDRQMQIIVTTHNPQMVKYSGIENLYLVHRDNGFSRISKPCEKEEVTHFLKDEMGVEDLFVQNMLEW